ncbi:MAG TPA: SPOR domain-containing protein [Ramlibacter sp.]|nr:SPOR domain-containing protein [Ramlibacter sp.]
MALFKLRKKVDEPKAAASPTESIEAVRRRARHRLIGAVVLVLAGVVGFPLLFDTQPRPVAVDIPIEIPDRNKAKPLAPPPAAPVAAGKVTPAPATPAAPVAAAPAPAADPKPDPAAVPAEKVAKADPAPEKKPEPKAEARPDPKVASAAETAKARALLEGRSVDMAEGGTRFVVQVGAFAERDKAKVAQQKLERAGLKNYTNVAETKEGKRIRVRAGPFASRAEADKAAEKIKGLDLPAAVLTL